MVSWGQGAAQHDESTATLHELHELLGLTRVQAPVARGQDHFRAIERKRRRFRYDGDVQVVRQLEGAEERAREVEIVDRPPGEQGLNRDAIHRTIVRQAAEAILRRTSTVSAAARSHVNAAARLFPSSPSVFLRTSSDSTLSSAPAIASTSSRSPSTAVPPASSGRAPVLPITAGAPRAAAPRRGRPKPSYRLVRASNDALL